MVYTWSLGAIQCGFCQEICSRDLQTLKSDNRSQNELFREMYAGYPECVKISLHFGQRGPSCRIIVLARDLPGYPET